MEEKEFLKLANELYEKHGGSSMGQGYFDLFAFDLAELYFEFKGEKA